MIGTITLNPSIDQFIIVRHLVKDDANRALSTYRHPGGKGANVSEVVKELGGQTCAHVLLGGLPGQLWKALVEKEKTPFSAVWIKGETRINTILTDIEDRTQTRVSAPGPIVSKKEIAVFLKKLLSAHPRPSFWVLGGSLARKMKSSTYREIINKLQKNGVLCVLDTDNEALKLGIEAKPFMIKPNEHEMQRLIGHRLLKTIEDYHDAAKLFVKKGVKVVVVSLGKRGALFVSGKESFHVTTPKVKVKRKVGAGDSLIGGFILGLCRKMSLQDAARLGVAASASAVMTEGPKLCRRTDIPKLLPRIIIRPLKQP